MTDIATAIQSLNKKGGNSHEFVVRGEPTNEAEYNSGVDFVSGSDANGTAIFSDTKPYTWSQIQTELPLVEFDNAMSNLRAKRNSLLAQTDYLALSDQTMSAEMSTYRQALRDITDGLTTVDEVNSVTWPTKP